MTLMSKMKNALRSILLAMSTVTGMIAIAVVLIMLFGSIFEAGWGGKESMAGMILFLFAALLSSLLHFAVFVTSRDWLKKKRVIYRRLHLVVWGGGFLIVVLGFVASNFHTPKIPEKAPDLTGRWHVDFDFAQNKHWALPKSFHDFHLQLKPDGTFIASNIPANFFFDYTDTPAAKEHQGKWEVKWESDDEFYHLYLDFTTMGGGFGTLIEWKNGAQTIYMGKQNRVFYLTKEESLP